MTSSRGLSGHPLRRRLRPAAARAALFLLRPAAQPAARGAALSSYVRCRAAQAPAARPPPCPRGTNTRAPRSGPARTYTALPLPPSGMRQIALQARAGAPERRARRRLGQYYTTRYNPFRLRPFRDWAARAGLSAVLEPFAGANHIVGMLREAGWSRVKATSYDVRPGSAAVKPLDTIRSFPGGHRNCISNPPWLGRSSAARRRLRYPDTPYDDLYKHCLYLALDHCENVAFLVPASFLRSGLFRERLRSIVLLHRLAFDGTENPTCLALFHAGRARQTAVWHDRRRIGTLDDLEKKLPRHGPAASRLRFNDPRGRLGLVGIAGARGPTIRFCRGAELPHTILHPSSPATRTGESGARRRDRAALPRAAGFPQGRARRAPRAVKGAARRRRARAAPRLPPGTEAD